MTVKELPLLSGDGHLVDCSGPVAKADLKWGTEAGWGGRAGPLRRSGKGSKLTLEEGKVSLEALMQRRGAWLSRDGDWGDWGQGCRGHLADQLGRSAFLCGVCVVVLVVVRVMAGDELAYEDSYLHSTFFLSGSWEKPRSHSGRSSPPLVCLPALMRPCWTPRSSLQG